MSDGLTQMTRDSAANFSKLLHGIIQGTSPAELASRASTRGGEGAEATASLSGGSSSLGGFGDLLGSIKDCGKSLICGQSLGNSGVAPLQPMQTAAITPGVVSFDGGSLGHFSSTSIGAGFNPGGFALSA